MTPSPGFMRATALFTLVLFWTASAHAQIDQRGLLSATSTGTTTSNYYFARPNELTIIVNVMGFIQRPGRYEISSTIDLMNLISLAGGPTSEGSLKNVKITRIVNTGAKMERKEVRLNLDDVTAINPVELVLQPGDIIEVDRSGWAGFRDVLGVALPIVSLAISVATLILITNRN